MSSARDYSTDVVLTFPRRCAASALSVDPGGAFTVVGSRNGLMLLNLDTPAVPPTVAPHASRADFAAVACAPHYRGLVATVLRGQAPHVLLWDVTGRSPLSSANSGASWTEALPIQSSLGPVVPPSRALVGALTLVPATFVPATRGGGFKPGPSPSHGGGARLNDGRGGDGEHGMNCGASNAIAWAPLCPWLLATCSSLHAAYSIWDVRLGSRSKAVATFDGGAVAPSLATGSLAAAPDAAVRGHSFSGAGTAAVAWHPARDRVLASARGGCVRVWDMRRGASGAVRTARSLPDAGDTGCVSVLYGQHTAAISGLAWRPDSGDDLYGGNARSDQLVTCGLDGRVFVWRALPGAHAAAPPSQVPSAEPARAAEQRATPLLDIKFSPCGDVVVSRAADDQLCSEHDADRIAGAALNSERGGGRNGGREASGPAGGSAGCGGALRVWAVEGILGSGDAVMRCPPIALGDAVRPTLSPDVCAAVHRASPSRPAPKLAAGSHQLLDSDRAASRSGARDAQEQQLGVLDFDWCNLPQRGDMGNFAPGTRLVVWHASQQLQVHLCTSSLHTAATPPWSSGPWGIGSGGARFGTGAFGGVAGTPGNALSLLKNDFEPLDLEPLNRNALLGRSQRGMNPSGQGLAKNDLGGGWVQPGYERSSNLFATGALVVANQAGSHPAGRLEPIANQDTPEGDFDDALPKPSLISRKSSNELIRQEAVGSDICSGDGNGAGGHEGRWRVWLKGFLDNDGRLRKGIDKSGILQKAQLFLARREQERRRKQDQTARSKASQSDCKKGETALSRNNIEGYNVPCPRYAGGGFSMSGHLVCFNVRAGYDGGMMERSSSAASDLNVAGAGGAANVAGVQTAGVGEDGSAGSVGQDSVGGQGDGNSGARSSEQPSDGAGVKSASTIDGNSRETDSDGVGKAGGSDNSGRGRWLNARAHVEEARHHALAAAEAAEAAREAARRVGAVFPLQQIRGQDTLQPSVHRAASFADLSASVQLSNSHSGEFFSGEQLPCLLGSSVGANRSRSGWRQPRDYDTLLAVRESLKDRAEGRAQSHADDISAYTQRNDERNGLGSPQGSSDDDDGEVSFMWNGELATQIGSDESQENSDESRDDGDDDGAEMEEAMQDAGGGEWSSDDGGYAVGFEYDDIGFGLAPVDDGDVLGAAPSETAKLLHEESNKMGSGGRGGPSHKQRSGGKGRKARARERSRRRRQQRQAINSIGSEPLAAESDISAGDLAPLVTSTGELNAEHANAWQTWLMRVGSTVTVTHLGLAVVDLGCAVYKAAVDAAAYATNAAQAASDAAEEARQMQANRQQRDDAAATRAVEEAEAASQQASAAALASQHAYALAAVFRPLPELAAAAPGRACLSLAFRYNLGFRWGVDEQSQAGGACSNGSLVSGVCSGAASGRSMDGSASRWMPGSNPRGTGRSDHMTALACRSNAAAACHAGRRDDSLAWALLSLSTTSPAELRRARARQRSSATELAHDSERTPNALAFLPPSLLHEPVVGFDDAAPTDMYSQGWASHPFGRMLARRLLTRHERTGDVQTLPTMICVLDHGRHRRHGRRAFALNDRAPALGVGAMGGSSSVKVMNARVAAAHAAATAAAAAFAAFIACAGAHDAVLVALHLECLAEENLSTDIFRSSGYDNGGSAFAKAEAKAAASAAASAAGAASAAAVSAASVVARASAAAGRQLPMPAWGSKMLGCGVQFAEDGRVLASAAPPTVEFDLDMLAVVVAAPTGAAPALASTLAASMSARAAVVALFAARAAAAAAERADDAVRGRSWAVVAEADGTVVPADDGVSLLDHDESPRSTLGAVQRQRHDSHLRRYAELLLRWGMLEARGEVCKHMAPAACGSDSTAANQESRPVKGRAPRVAAAHEALPAAPAVQDKRLCFIEARCSRCDVSLPSHAISDGAQAWCDECKRFNLECALCRLPVRGAGLFWLRCGHGGHMNCMQSWFSQNSCCPQCGEAAHPETG